MIEITGQRKLNQLQESLRKKARTSLHLEQRLQIQEIQNLSAVCICKVEQTYSLQHTDLPFPDHCDKAHHSKLFGYPVHIKVRFMLYCGLLKYAVV